MTEAAGTLGAPARLIVLQGSTQSLTACAAVAEREIDNKLNNLLLVGGLASANADGLAKITLSCCGSRTWGAVIPDEVATSADALRSHLSSRWRIDEVLAVRNWQGINEVPLRAFPDARRINYGDALGFVRQRRDPGDLRFHEAMVVLPHPASAETFGDIDLRVISKERFLRVIEETRETLPQLVEMDRQLAEFARGGLLLLPSYLTEVRTASRRGEIAHLKRLINAVGPKPGTPVVIKPHPRSSLGQAASIARYLREQGHPVRVLEGTELGFFPIELFTDTVRAVAVAEGGASASIVGLKYLYGTDARATNVYSGQWTSFSRGAEQQLARLSRSYTEHLALLESWDQRSPLPPPEQAPEPPPLVERAHRVPWKLLNWRPLLTPRHRGVSLAVDAGPRLTDGRVKIVDRRGAAIWWTPAGTESLLSALTELKHEDHVERLAAQLDLLAASAPGATVELLAAVLPPSHGPALRTVLARYLPAPVYAGAGLTAEEVENVIETRADVLERSPTLEAWCVRRRGIYAGHVRFRLQLRVPCPRHSEQCVAS